jgi:hypothetical protein
MGRVATPDERSTTADEGSTHAVINGSLSMKYPLLALALLALLPLASCSDYPPSVSNRSEVLGLPPADITFLCARELPEADIPLLVRFANLEWIDFESGGTENVGITDSGVEVLMSLELEKLDFIKLGHNRSITDTSLEVLGRTYGMGGLSFVDCQEITVAGLEHLRNLDGLSYLDLTNCKGIVVSELDLREGFSALTHLIIKGCTGLDDENFGRIQASRPGVFVE